MQSRPWRRWLVLFACLLPSLDAQNTVGPLSEMRIPVWDWLQPDHPITRRYLYLAPSADFSLERRADGITWEFRLVRPPGTNPTIEPVFSDVIGAPCVLGAGGHDHTVAPDGLYVCAPVVAETGAVSRVWRFIGWP